MRKTKGGQAELKAENVPGVFSSSWIGMNQCEPGSIVVGVDVGGSRKGFHAVALQDGQYREKLSTLVAEEVAEWCRRLTAANDLGVGFSA